MKHTFVWCDLSCFDLRGAQQFYGTVFGWNYTNDGEYSIASTPGAESTGLFTMPEKFQQMGMPSFWMSYIAVDDIERIVALAEQSGAKVEIGPTEFNRSGKIALIRDPLGAGFTVYEGPDLGGRDLDNTPGRMIYNQLYVSDVSAVKHFYQTVFGWEFTERSKDLYDVSHGGKVVASIAEVPDEVRGKEQFWAVHFAVADRTKTEKIIRKHGGSVWVRESDGSWITDPWGATFYIAEFSPSSRGSVEGVEQKNLARKKSPILWRSTLAIICIYSAVMLEMAWIWGVLFLLWVLPDLRSGTTYLLEPIPRKTNPVLYWIVILSWIWMAGYVFLTSFK